MDSVTARTCPAATQLFVRPLRTLVVTIITDAYGFASTTNNALDGSNQFETFALIFKTADGLTFRTAKWNRPTTLEVSQETEPLGVHTSSGNVQKILSGPAGNAVNAHFTSTPQEVLAGRVST